MSDPNDERIGRDEIEHLQTRLGKVSNRLNNRRLTQGIRVSEPVQLNLTECAILEISIDVLLKSMGNNHE